MLRDLFPFDQASLVRGAAVAMCAAAELAALGIFLSFIAIIANVLGGN